MEIEDIIGAIGAGKIVPSRHSLRAATEDDLVMGEVYLSVTEKGEVIEDYPDAYPMPACLILGFNTLILLMSRFIRSGATMESIKLLG